ncbi:unnamed protein product [Cuscuta campestris]|uniref:Uncharacterized protein n=1 Tax=Cuscuta campestris TaxID=132261 RepID=A0A484LBD0_9ASTE|nr:unnamed protein product [Cuscuta campestris]
MGYGNRDTTPAIEKLRRRWSRDAGGREMRAANLSPISENQGRKREVTSTVEKRQRQWRSDGLSTQLGVASMERPPWSSRLKTLSKKLLEIERELHLLEPRSHEEGKSSSSGVSNFHLSGGLGESSSRDVQAFYEDEYLERSPRTSRSKTLSNLKKRVSKLEKDMSVMKRRKLSKRFWSDVRKVSLQIFELESESQELSHKDGWGVSNLPSSEGDMPEFDEIPSAPTQAAGDVEVCDEKENSESPRAMLASEVSDDETRSSPTQVACDMEIGDEEKEKSESPSDLESLSSCGSEFEYTLTEEEEETPVRENEFEGYARAKKVHHCLEHIYAGMKRFADHSTKGRALFHALISTAAIVGLLFDKEDYYCFGMSAEMTEQLNDLWNEILDKTKEVFGKTKGGSSFLPFFNLIADGKIDFEKYPLVGEYDVAYMLGVRFSYDSISIYLLVINL